VDIDEDSWISKSVTEQAPGNMNSLHSSTSLISSAMPTISADRDVDDVASVASIYTESGKMPGAARDALNRTERMWRSINLNRKNGGRHDAKGVERQLDENLSGNTSPIGVTSSRDEAFDAAQKDWMDANRAPSPLSRKQQVPNILDRRPFAETAHRDPSSDCFSPFSLPTTCVLKKGSPHSKVDPTNYGSAAEYAAALSEQEANDSKHGLLNVDIDAVLDDADEEVSCKAKKELADIGAALSVRGQLLAETMGLHASDWHDHSHIDETNHEAVWRRVIPATASVSFHPKEHPDRPTLLAELTEEADRTKREGIALQKKVDEEVNTRRLSSPDKYDDSTIAVPSTKVVSKQQQRQRRKNKQADEIITDPFIAFGLLDDQRTRDAKMQMQVCPFPRIVHTFSSHRRTSSCLWSSPCVIQIPRSYTVQLSLTADTGPIYSERKMTLRKRLGRR
jgi:hypothetical protein